MNLGLKRLTVYAFVAFVFLMIAGIGINAYVVRASADAQYTQTDTIPAKQTALVLGARVYDSGAVSPILEDRLKTAAAVYENGKVMKLIVSGDHGREEYDEVRAMRDYLVDAGIPAEDIFMDHAGFDTYDSVYRARDVFQAESLIIVTQAFHLPRALYIAQGLGIEATGIEADLREYSVAAVRRNAWREPLARIKAFGSVLIGARPTYLGEAIPVTGDGRMTDDRAE